MAKAPIICQADIANTLIQSGHFDRCTFKITKDNGLVNSFNFCDFSMDIDEFFSQTVRLKGGMAFLLDDGGISNSFGEVKFLVIKATYSATFTKDSDKYINLIYAEKTYPMGEITIWSGEPNDTDQGRGIILNTNGVGLSSPYFSKGGLVLHNPHPGVVDLKILIASSAIQGETKGEIPIISQVGDILLPDGDYLIQ
jgi:hypothetical protein